MNARTSIGTGYGSEYGGCITGGERVLINWEAADQRLDVRAARCTLVPRLPDYGDIGDVTVESVVSSDGGLCLRLFGLGSNESPIS